MTRHAQRFSLFFIPLLLSLLNACSTLPENIDRTESHTIRETSHTFLGESLQRSRAQGITDDGFVLLGNGLDAFVARATLAKLAEKTLDVQYYLYHDDLVGELFTAILLKAADRGVRVRLLVDDMGMQGKDESLIAFNQHPNIEIRIFNPFNRDMGRGVQFLSGFGTITRRMHNKSFTADNVSTILGGRNIGNEYFEADPSLEFADLDVMAIGDIVNDVSTSFDLYWNSQLAYPVETLLPKRLSASELQEQTDKLKATLNNSDTSKYISALQNSPLAKQIENKQVKYQLGNANILVDHPDKITHSRDATELHLSTQLSPYFDNINNELIIVSPYFVPGDEGVEFLTQLVDKGVRVAILTNSLSSNDVLVVHAGYANYRKALLQGGVELYEMNKKLTREQRKSKKKDSTSTGSSKASLHAKTFVLDRQKVFIGSLNLDPRSFYENTEIGLIINSSEIAERMANSFSSDIARYAFHLKLDKHDNIVWHGYDQGEKIQFDSDPYASFWRKLSTRFLGLFPIESQL